MKHCVCHLCGPGSPYGLPPCNLCRLAAERDDYHQLFHGKPRPRTPLPCVHLGVETGETVQCPHCPNDLTNTTARKVYGCAVHGETVGRHYAKGRKSCIGCHEAKPIAPVADVPIRGLPGRSFNGSIAEWGGRTWLAYRQSWSSARVAIVEVGPDWQPIGAPRVLELGRLPEDRLGQEDPRLWVYRGSLFVSYSGVAFPVRDKLTVSVCCARLDDGLRVEHAWYPEFAGRQEWEKNWGFFEAAGDLLTVHTIPGQRVLILPGEGHAVDYTQVAVDLPGAIYGDLRGGAPPVRVGDEYYSWLHGRTREGLYTIGLYTFAAEPPFRPLRFARVPLLYPDPTRKPGGWVANVVFPGGAILRGGFWHVCYGSFDTEIRVATWRADEVERCLMGVGV